MIWNANTIYFRLLLTVLIFALRTFKYKLLYLYTFTSSKSSICDSNYIDGGQIIYNDDGNTHKFYNKVNSVKFGVLKRGFGPRRWVEIIENLHQEVSNHHTNPEWSCLASQYAMAYDDVMIVSMVPFACWLVMHTRIGLLGTCRYLIGAKI